MDALKEGLVVVGVNYTETRFRSDEGIDNIKTDIFVSFSKYVINKQTI